MYTNNCLLILLLTHIWSVDCFFSSTWIENGHVIVLNNENFQIETQDYDFLLVMFYVRWCSFCQRLHPEYEKAATELSQQTDLPIHIAKFDCTRDREAQCGQRYGIHGYPALRIYRHGRFRGEELNYQNRTANEIVKTMKRFYQETQEPSLKLRGCSKCRRIQDQPKQTALSSTIFRTNRWLLFGCIILLWKYL